MKKISRLLMVAVVAALVAVLSVGYAAADSLEDVTIDGITYCLKNNTYFRVESVDNSLEGEIVIPAEIDGFPVVEIVNGAFRGCSKITKVVIPEGVTSIIGYTFSGCEKLEEVSIPSTVTKIPNGFFYNCDSLVSFDFPEHITYIGQIVFKDCDNLKRTSVGKNVTVISETAFSQCPGLREIVIDEENENYTVDEYGVVYTADKTLLIQFPAASELKSYTVPASVEKIGEMAFSDCVTLNEITVPDSVLRIGLNAFKGSGYYNNRDNWENDVLYVGGHLVASEATGKLTVRNGTVNIADGAVSNTKATEIILPGSVRRIGVNSFSYGKDLEKITLNEGLEYIGEMAFRENPALKSVVIPDSVTEIGGSAFYRCTALTSLHIGKGITEIKDAVFHTCSALEVIHIPGNVETVGEDAFAYCKNAKKIIIDEGVKTIKAFAFRYCRAVESIYFPDSIKEIGEYITESCAWLETVRIGKNIQSLDHKAFSNYFSFSSVDEIYFAGTKEEWAALKPSDWCRIFYEHPVIGHSYTNYVYDGNASYCYDGTMTAKCDYETCGLTRTVEDDKNRFALDTVTGLTVTDVTETTVTLKWNKVPHASGYRVYRQNSDGTWKAIKQFKDTEYTVSKLATGKEYKFAVKAYAYGTAHAYGYSFECWRYADEYAEISVKTAPTAPTGKIKTSGPGYVTLSWSKATGATGYRVYRLTSKGWKALKTTTATSYTVSGLTNGTSYTFAIRPYAKYNGSYYWASSYTRVKATVPYLEMPALRVASTANGRATLAWYDIDGENGYQVWYSTSADGKYTKITNCKAGTEKYYKTGLTSGKTYYFKVRAYAKTDSGYVYSAWSDVKSVKVK